MREPFEEAGFWWPRGCWGKTKRYLNHRRDSERAWRLCRKRRVVVQAGALNGVWPLYLVKYFKRVVTFEPAEDNHWCAQKNIGENRRIELRRALLGERSGEGCIDLHFKNAGGNRAWFGPADDPDKPPSRVPAQPVPVIAIDDLGLEGVDLIALDIEGAELPALKGAVRTIFRCRPIIMLEMRGHGERFGYTDKELEEWLRLADYRFVSKISRDRIWAPV